MSDENLIKRLSELSEDEQAKVKYYIGVFDRVLLQALVLNFLEPEIVNAIFDMCEKLMKTEIDVEATIRTKFLQETEAGRIISQLNFSDGESLRLRNLEAVKVARGIAENNYSK